MDEDFDFFSTDINNWNYNEFKNQTVVDPYNNKKKLDPFGYNLMKCNTVIMLREILKHTKQYLENDVIEWIFKKALITRQASTLKKLTRQASALKKKPLWCWKYLLCC